MRGTQKEQEEAARAFPPPVHSFKDTLGGEGYACSPGALPWRTRRASVTPTFPFSFPGLQSHPPLPSGPPSTLLMNTPTRLPLPTTSSWLLDAHTLSLALITKVTALWPRLASGLPPRDGAVPLCSHTPQSPYPRLTGDWFTALERPAFPLSPPTSARKCTSQTAVSPARSRHRGQCP